MKQWWSGKNLNVINIMRITDVFDGDTTYCLWISLIEGEGIEVRLPGTLPDAVHASWRLHAFLQMKHKDILNKDL